MRFCFCWSIWPWWALCSHAGRQSWGADVAQNWGHVQFPDPRGRQPGTLIRGLGLPCSILTYSSLFWPSRLPTPAECLPFLRRGTANGGRRALCLRHPPGEVKPKASQLFLFMHRAPAIKSQSDHAMRRAIILRATGGQHSERRWKLMRICLNIDAGMLAKCVAFENHSMPPEAATVS